MKKNFFLLFVLILSFIGVFGQTLSLNTVGKETVNGKFQQLILKEDKGEWKVQFFDHKIISFEFNSNQIENQEQISESVIAKPILQQIQVKKTAVYSIQLQNGINLVYQQGAWYYKEGNQVLLKKITPIHTKDERGFEFVINPEENFYGGGERALSLNRKGYSFPLYNNPHYGYEMGADALNFSVPLILSSEGYAVFFNNVSRGVIDLGKTDARVWRTSFYSGALQFYVIPGKNIQQILSNYHSLTGTQPLPPRWALGNFVSRFGYRSEAQVKEVVDTMQKTNFKMDALIFDLFWFGDSIKGTMGNLDWVNKTKWPNPPAMLKSLQQKQIKPIAIIEPFVLQGTAQFQNAQSSLALDIQKKPYLLQDFYFGVGGLVDIFKPSAQQFMSKFYQQQMKNGIIGWWTDLGEPEKHPSDLYHDLSSFGFKRLFAADEVHNAYGHYWNKFVFDLHQKEKRNERLFHLNRSGFAGSQRYSVFPWTGDVSRTWNGLKAQIPLLLGMSMSGFPYVHADAGGFSMVDKADPELYVRWLSFAAFTPIFRPHGTALGDLESPEKDIPSEPAYWNEPYRSFVKNWVDLRYALVPYNYNLSFQQTKDGKPLMRSLNYQDFKINSDEIDKAYYWGDAFYVHPITDAGISEMKFTLPAGNWYDFYSNELKTGLSTIAQTYSLQKMPLFVKAGSFIPFWTQSAKYNSMDAYKGDSLSIYYYPSEQTTLYEWFDDDGASANSLEKAAYEIIHFKGSAKGSKIEIEINTPILKSNQMKKRVLEFYIPQIQEIQSIELNGSPLAFQKDQLGNAVLQEGKFVKFTLRFDGKPLKIVLQ